MNLSTALSLGLGIRIQGWELPGRRANGWRNSSHITERCWFWTAWNRFNIRLVRKRVACVSLRSKRFYASLLLSILDFA
jgi:hypothetical protein